MSVKDFDLKDNDAAVNLTNWAVQKHLKAKDEVCMLNYEEFRSFIIDTFSHQKWYALMVDIYSIIALASMSCHNNIERRNNT